MVSQKLFAFRNVKTDSVEFYCTGVNFSLLVRNNYGGWLQMFPFLLDDFEVLELGEFDTSTGLNFYAYEEPKICDWQDYESEMFKIPSRLSPTVLANMQTEFNKNVENLTKTSEKLMELHKLNSKGLIRPLSNEVDAQGVEKTLDK